MDGAYGAAAVLSSRYRERLASLALADSVGLDPHKWLYVPVEAGFVLVRDVRSFDRRSVLCRLISEPMATHVASEVRPGSANWAFNSRADFARSKSG